MRYKGGTRSVSFFHMSVQEKIQQLLWDKRYIRIPEDVCPSDLTYILIKDMTIEDRNLYTFVRSKELALARKQGVPTEAELLAEAKKVGLWTAEDDLVVAKADEHIEFLKSEQNRQKFLARKKSLQIDIDAALAKKLTTQSKKNDYFINSADYYANEIAASTLARRVAFNIDDEPLWPSDDSFLYFKQYHQAFVFFVINEVLSEGVMPIDEIREVAHHPEWRLTWTLQREYLPAIFNRNICDLNLNQKLLIYWSRVYDSAFESQEPPTTEVVNDDEKFDEWLANRELSAKEDDSTKRIDTKHHQEHMQILDGEYSEICNCGAKAKNVGKGLGERIRHTQVCPWGTFHRYTRAEREKIASRTYSRNTDRVRNLIDQEQQTIIDKGSIEEQKLRGKKTRHILGMKTDVVSRHK